MIVVKISIGKIILSRILLIFGNNLILYFQFKTNCKIKKMVINLYAGKPRIF